MIPVSVVIIAKNEAHIIGETVRAVSALTNDIIIVDSGSTDETKAIARLQGARVIESEWNGFGPTKNKGIAEARFDWILSIDADEQPDKELVSSLQKLDLSSDSIVYRLRFKTFLGKKLIRYGEWGNDSHIRLFNRKAIRWNDAEVHEQLILPANTTVGHLNGFILHYSMKDVAEYATKMTRYALLNAENYFARGKKAGWIKRNISPGFSFIQNYILKLGFLDGYEGYLIAKVTVFYTLLKYARLYELTRNLNK